MSSGDAIGGLGSASFPPILRAKNGWHCRHFWLLGGLCRVGQETGHSDSGNG
jgi:hypothetical protein